jgi:hypothetical protein
MKWGSTKTKIGQTLAGDDKTPKTNFNTTSGILIK